MRLLPLVRLAGLIGLAAASPVIGLEAGKDANVTPPRRLVVYTQVNFTGTPYEIHAEKGCVQFVAPVYKNLQSFKVADQVCYFMDEDACGGKALVIVDALGAEAWANTDDGTNFSSRITSVYCEDHSMRPPGGADAAVVKRDGPGETTVCRSTMDIGPCVTLSANSACVFFGYELRHNIRNVYQAYGSICNYYYDGNCDVSTPVMTVNTHKQALHVPLDKQTGDRLAYVKCQDQWSAQDIQDDTVHIFPRADDVHSIGVATEAQPRSTTATPCDDPRYVDPDANVGPGFVYFCWGRKGGTERTVNLPILVSRRSHAIQSVPVNDQSAPEANTEQLQPTIKREEVLPLGSAGQVLVADREGFGGKTQLVDTVKDDNNCAPLFNQFFWNLQSLIQYQGSVCTYWQYDCGDLLPDNKPVFTVDSLGGQIGLSPIPWVFGGENRNKIAYIRCINGKAAVDYIAALDPSEKVINNETHGVAKNTAFSTGLQDGQLAARAESMAEDYFEPLTLYRDPDKGGAVMTYVGPSCGLNPFNVDPIKSLWQDKGFLCQFYPEWGCQETKGPPLWIDSRDGPCYNRNVEFPILSISCTRSTYEDVTGRPDTTQLIEYKAEATPAAVTPGTITPATLAIRTDAANTFTPLKFCTGENLTGACFSYTGPDCASGDPAIFEMKSIVVDKDFQCVFMSGLNCNEGYPHYVDARQDENRINSIDWIVKSIYCKPEPWHG
ncbi:hypothetical protein HBI56_033780 [Parastagonospora nodorum]|nr:hypothetical protein HBI10_012840 [Parastagonospora nodorum]KAH4011454.1 hypothetical protein HBI13_197750 [Parastagonospora nodorum]KAH4034623.1 hypothetical protein HBI09_101250 [Parastagonospora nodorum]KAH4343412.1 hypothetical protein HBH98_149530 [Parastagonospora nodorum]KAH4368201.1 hypothetical protein HBH97_155340 [Parastagonospora nodorum]